MSLIIRPVDNLRDTASCDLYWEHLGHGHSYVVDDLSHATASEGS